MSERVALFFDLDRTLWDFEKNSLETLRGLFLDFSLDERGDGGFDAFNAIYQRENAQCWADYRQGKMQKEVLRSERFKRALSGFGANDLELAEKLGVAIR